MNKPYFSVIIPAYNEEHYIEGILKDLSNQSFRDFELIIVDNNSTDNTIEVIEKLHSTKFRNLKLKIINCLDQGIAPARNKGAEQATSDLLVFFDADLRLEKNWLKKAHKMFEFNSELIALNGLLWIPHNNILKRTYYNMYTVLSYATLLFLGMTTGKQHIAGNNLVIKKEWFKKAGMFPNLICEDFIFSGQLYKYLDNPRRQTRIKHRIFGYWHPRRFEEKGLLRSVAQWYWYAFKHRKAKDYDVYR